MAVGKTNPPAGSLQVAYRSPEKGFTPFSAAGDGAVGVCTSDGRKLCDV